MLSWLLVLWLLLCPDHHYFHHHHHHHVRVVAPVFVDCAPTVGDELVIPDASGVVYAADLGDGVFRVKAAGVYGTNPAGGSVFDGFVRVEALDAGRQVGYWTHQFPRCAGF